MSCVACFYRVPLTSLEQDEKLNEFGNERNAGGNENKEKPHLIKRTVGIPGVVLYLFNAAGIIGTKRRRSRKSDGFSSNRRTLVVGGKVR